MIRLLAVLLLVTAAQAAEPRPNPPSEPSRAQMEEIQSLREQNSDRSWASDNRAEFEQALQRRFANGTDSLSGPAPDFRQLPSTSNINGPVYRFGPVQTGDYSKAYPQPPSSQPPQLSHQLPPHPPREPKRLLREIAFDMDRKAHELEMAEQYDVADQLRHVSKSLREKARELAKSEKPHNR